MLQNAYFLAKIGADTAENEQHFADILPKTGYAAAPRALSAPHGRCARGRRELLMLNPESRVDVIVRF